MKFGLYVFHRPLVLLVGLWRRMVRAIRFSIGVFVGIALFIASFFLAGNLLVSTPRVGAYRTLHPGTHICQAGLSKGWDELADRRWLSSAPTTDDNGWRDPTNDELKAIETNPGLAAGFQCALQKHIVPSSVGNDKSLTYYLGFLDFQETGQPYPLLGDNQTDLPIELVYPEHDIVDPAKRRPLDERTNAVRPLLTQLDVLKDHLSSGSNYVIVFIHGWRHNASIGDGNVADLRHYAAHAVRFLKQRCEVTRQKYFCEARVTAIYVGWRGARVDEAALTRILGKTVGGTLGATFALATLFDRKPVSEQVAPGAISAIRGLEEVLSPTKSNGTPKTNPHSNKMIIFGHSLGGNMLATGLQADLIKMVRMHMPGQEMPPVLGDLVVLINPASEATKWTSIQREIWDRIPYHVDKNTPITLVAKGEKFFPVNQRPVVVSITSALAFPPGGLRDSDCVWLKFKAQTTKRLNEKIGKGGASVDYDWATQELFPAFKFDFRPLSLLIERWAAYLERRKHAPGQSCEPDPPHPWSKFMVRPIYWLSEFVANFPFQNTNDELSHTIGHLDPLRPADGAINNQSYYPAAPFGTTHELFGSQKSGEIHIPYARLADADLKCSISNYWLSYARAKKTPSGTFWDSQDLVPAKDAVKPAAQFLHGALLSGSGPITRANDPFWNMRAFDNALARHDGYRFSSFICSMNQLVMDDVAGVPPSVALPEKLPAQDILPRPSKGD